MNQHQVMKCVGLLGLIALGSVSAQAGQVNSDLSCSDLLTTVYNQDFVQIGAQNYGRACSGQRTLVSTRDNARCMELNLCVAVAPTPAHPDYPTYDDGSSWGGGGYYDSGSHYNGGGSEGSGSGGDNGGGGGGGGGSDSGGHGGSCGAGGNSGGDGGGGGGGN